MEVLWRDSKSQYIVKMMGNVSGRLCADVADSAGSTVLPDFVTW